MASLAPLGFPTLPGHPSDFITFAPITHADLIGPKIAAAEGALVRSLETAIFPTDPFTKGSYLFNLFADQPTYLTPDSLSALTEDIWQTATDQLSQTLSASVHQTNLSGILGADSLETVAADLTHFLPEALTFLG